MSATSELEGVVLAHKELLDSVRHLAWQGVTLDDAMVALAQVREEIKVGHEHWSRLFDQCHELRGRRP